MILTFSIVAELAVVVIVFWLARWRMHGVVPLLARVLLELAGTLRYRRRWLDALRLVNELAEERTELMESTERALSAGETFRAALEGERTTVRELQETIAELCVDYAELEGAKGAELIREAERLGVEVAARAGRTEARRQARMDAAFEQARRAREAN